MGELYIHIILLKKSILKDIYSGYILYYIIILYYIMLYSAEGTSMVTVFIQWFVVEQQ